MEYEKSYKLKDLKASNNIVDMLEDEQLADIGHQVVKGFEIDESSRAEWQSTVDEAMEIAKQVMKQKSFPWTNASNIKYPLITQASIDYASRTLPEIIQNDKVVKASVMGKDRNDAKYARANRVSKFMSHQLIVQSPDWEDGTDKLLQILPVLGTVFKKTYYDELERRNKSDLCVPEKIVVNYGVQSLEAARRVTHCLTFYKNDIIERQRHGIFAECEIDELNPSPESDMEDSDYALEFLEQHCYYDLDGDGYKEPYIVTVHKETKKVLRIVNRFDKISKNSKGEVQSITPVQYFTDFHFIRSPDGGFYSMGFGSLLLPINKAINTLLNQLVDSGTLNNTQGGLIGRGLRIRDGQLKFKMGTWQKLDSASDDISKQIFPWPTKEPSQTLFSLLSLLMQVGKDLSSTTDVLSGKQPAQNVASSTVSQLVEQGTKVFIAINKRLYRSLKKEYKKLYKLNLSHLRQEEYIKVLDDQEANVKKDFAIDDMDIVPVADPTVSSETQRIQRAGIIQQLRTADPREADKLLLQSMQLDSELIDRLLPAPDPNAPPPPEAVKMQAETEKLKADIAKISAEATLASEKNAMEQAKIQQELAESQSRVQESMARIWKMEQDALNNKNKTDITAHKMTSEQEMKQISALHEIDKSQADVALRSREAAVKERQIVEKSNGDKEA